MACCEAHDRMDLLLQITEYFDFPCGTPTKPRGEPRYCCRQCPSIGQPLPIKAQWAANPRLLAFLSDEERAAVLALAAAAGPTQAEIVLAVPEPAKNGVSG